MKNLLKVFCVIRVNHNALMGSQALLRCFQDRWNRRRITAVGTDRYNLLVLRKCFESFFQAVTVACVQTVLEQSRH